MRKLGVETQNAAEGSFCGVPLMLYDRAIGAMSVHSPRGTRFDEDHLEMMRVLASEATHRPGKCAAVPRRADKSRHLTLLNNISRNAIATLNPDEMLASIAEELEGGLDYSITSASACWITPQGSRDSGRSGHAARALWAGA